MPVRQEHHCPATGPRRKFGNGKHKARLIARGFTQVFGIDYHEARLCASVVRLETLVLIATLFNHDLVQFDVSAAYLRGEIDGEIYMEPPPGYRAGGHCKAPPEGPLQIEAGWHERHKANMEELGFLQCQRDHTVFRIGDLGNPDWAVSAFWVDETGMGSRQQLERVATMFSRNYGISREGRCVGP